MNIEVDVELLVPSGGARTYSYAYPFDAEPPVPGDAAVVPFRNSLAPALVLGCRRQLRLSEERTLRPLFGVERAETALGRLCKLTLGTAATEMKTARDALSFYLAAPPEHEIDVFFFARAD